MKNSKLKVLIIILFFLLITVLPGCNGNLHWRKIESPLITAIGNIIYWSNVENADEYEIYCNDQLIKTTKGNGYYKNEIRTNEQYHVVAKGENMRDSDPSNKVTLYKNANFSKDETMEISLTNNMEYVIPSNIKYISITGKGTETNIKIAERTDDITIKLNNVTLVSGSGKDCIGTADGKFNQTEKKFTSTIVVCGANILTGGKGKDAVGQPADNSGLKGYSGENGGTGIVLPQICIIGDGTITINGAPGGDGGTGAASSGFSTSSCGNGGNGGNGGCGIKCSTLIISMAIGSVVKSYGARGGFGGNPGGNGSIITGPIISISGKWYDSYGIDGTTGVSVKGNIIQLGGGLLGDYTNEQIKTIPM